MLFPIPVNNYRFAITTYELISGKDAWPQQEKCKKNIILCSRCQRLGLTRSVRNKPRARRASIERRRRESPPEAKDERSESFTGGARGFAKQNRVFEHSHLHLCRPEVSIQRKSLPKK